MSNFPGLTNATLQKVADKLLTCVRSNTGTAPAAAPNAFKDRLGKVLTCSSGEVTITLRIENQGQAAWLKIVPNDYNAAPAFEGSVDIPTLAGILA